MGYRVKFCLQMFGWGCILKNYIYKLVPNKDKMPLTLQFALVIIRLLVKPLRPLEAQIIL
ncbi:hypothetical protein SBF1_4820011 [Candidatus Desulfosporosinus infrequens]|uniref:Uncharacterized protein n=1 Tax=Candidatus Desulfosporosinus infrequens TaxID=2043169 RepID=A0A2U3LFJ7_9FIRM|nr:hypothetical protein SBF1_4820011 [Candidatus Desulfosporosinus infrequens]